MDKKNKIMLETSFWFYNCIHLKYNLQPSYEYLNL